MGAGGLEAVIFDLDGVLIDSETTLYRLWGDLFAEYGASFSRTEWQGLIGTTEGESPYAWLERRAARPLPDPAVLRAETHARELAAIGALGPMPGVLDWIEAAEAAGLALGVASSSSPGWVEPRLEQLGVRDRFAAVVCPDGVRRSKPAPDLYLAVCAQLGAPPERALAIEDSPNGVRAARAAGLRCLAVPCELTADTALEEADLRLDSLASASLADVLVHLGLPTPG